MTTPSTAHATTKREHHSFFTPIDATFRHPFTMLIAGPSGSGKSTFVENLLKRAPEFIDESLDYVHIYIGTAREQNELFSNLVDTLRKTISEVKIIEVNKLFSTKDDIRKKFPSYFEESTGRHKSEGKKGCVVFDDLMQELGDSELLVTAFTRLSSHNDISIIFITQNLYFKGRRSSDNVTIFRNSRYLVLFKSRIDNTVISYVVSKFGLARGKANKLKEMLQSIMEKHRYVVINADLERDARLQYSSNIFAETNILEPSLATPIKYQLVFSPNF